MVRQSSIKVCSLLLKCSLSYCKFNLLVRMCIMKSYSEYIKISCVKKIKSTICLGAQFINLILFHILLCMMHSCNSTK